MALRTRRHLLRNVFAQYASPLTCPQCCRVPATIRFQRNTKCIEFSGENRSLKSPTTSAISYKKYDYAVASAFEMTKLCPLKVRTCLLQKIASLNTSLAYYLPLRLQKLCEPKHEDLVTLNVIFRDRQGSDQWRETQLDLCEEAAQIAAVGHPPQRLTDKNALKGLKWTFVFTYTKPLATIYEKLQRCSDWSTAVLL